MLPIKGPVLAAVAFDGGSQEVLRQADALARSCNADLHVCHILAGISAVRPLFPYLHLDDALKMTQWEASLHSALVENVCAMTGRTPDQFHMEIEYGTVHSGILGEAERLSAGAIVIGGETEKHTLPALGGIAERVTRYAGCPVLVVRPPREGKVLAATDFSNPSLPAIAAGASEAKRLNTDLVVIHAMELIPLAMPTMNGFAAFPAVPANMSDHIRKASQRELDDCVRRFDARGGGLLRDGPPAEAIIQAAAELPAALIVVGTHGRTGLGRLALGSVAETVVRDSPCSILVVRIHSGEAGN